MPHQVQRLLVLELAQQMQVQLRETADDLAQAVTATVTWKLWCTLQAAATQLPGLVPLHTRRTQSLQTK